MNRLKKLRSEAGYSLRELDKLTGISYSSLSHLENEGFNFTEDNIRLLSAFFNVSSDYLLGISDVRNVLVYEKGKEPLEEVDEFQFALYDEVKQLTTTQKKDILEMVKKMKEIIVKNEK